MRLAWFSPFPPVRSGISRDSAELVAALRARGFAVDPYPSDRAHDFPWKHRQQPYDLVVYQFGNSSNHDYQWAYALRYPGLVVLHDTRLHHARAAFLLREKRADDYRVEFSYNHPDASPDVAEVAVAGLDSALYYQWPMVKALVDGSRLVAVHGEGAARELRAALQPGDRIVSIRLGHGQLVTAEGRARARASVRARHAIPDDAVVFTCAGGITPDKRIPQVLDGFRATLRHTPSARLLLVGAVAAHYDVHHEIAAHDLADRVIVTGYVDSDADLTEYLAASDVSLNLRWPTARETSGPWLRALAAGVATVTIDLAHMGEVPSLDPRTWTANTIVHGSSSAHGPSDPVTVAIDILDEDHSLRLAMRRLAGDADLRARLGRAGQEYWIREHSVAGMVDDYERIIATAAARSDPSVSLPPHMRNEADGLLREILAPFGIADPLRAGR